ncbi:MAG: DNA/RNA non-specific endonuclease [Bacteroidota bacterium]|nr:MAG: DNA/RNA non-specific endonuclease [Bacteroidota bacterium]
MYYYFTCFLLLLSLCLSGQGLPVCDSCQIIEHRHYTLCYSEKHEQAKWVYYELTKAEVQSNTARKEAFREDAKVATGSASLADYKSSGYDRGHLAPAADMEMDSLAMAESFYMSNMSPQKPSFNRGIWKKLEMQVRDWAVQEDTILVVTGPVFVDNLGAIGENRVTVPGYYYKIILDVTGEKKIVAFLMKNEASSEELFHFTIPADSLEVLTGINFFPELEAIVEKGEKGNANGFTFTL